MTLRPLLARLGGLRRARPAPTPAPGTDTRRAIFAEPRVAGEAPADRAAFEAAVDLPHGTAAPADVLAALAADIHARRARTGTLDGPASPVASGLAIRREGLPDWWHASRNLLLCAPDAPPLDLQPGMLGAPGRGAVVVIGAGVQPPRLDIVAGLNRHGPALIVIGDRTQLGSGTVAVNGPSTILIGEDTTATFLPGVTAHNGGIVVTGADGMWAPGVQFMTDDSHAIIDLTTGRRINRFGGRIVVGRHVWLGWATALSGDAFVGDGCVVGQGSLVRNLRLAANSMASGRPARALREDVSWTREDTPPDGG